jgi:hypothetical protein
MTFFFFVKPVKDSLSVHEQIRFPMIVNRPNEISDKHDVVRPDRPAQQRHLSLRRSSVSLFVIASDAGTHEIFPCVISTTSARNDMIYGQGNIGTAAVLAPMTIATKNVLS